MDGKEIEVPKTTPDPITGKPIPDDDDPGVRAGEGGCAALLLSSQAAGGGQLPHVPGGVRHAGDGAGPQADAESGWHAEDREIAAPGHRLRHADFAGHGDLHQHARA